MNAAVSDDSSRSSTCLTRFLVAGLAIVFLGGGCERAGTSYERPEHIAGLERVPPPPNFFDPVDYVAWLDEQGAADAPPDWTNTYKAFWKTSSACAYQKEFMAY